MGEFHCRGHKGVTGMICDMVGTCPLGGASSDQKRGAFPFGGKGTIPRSPSADVYKAPTKHQRQVAESTVDKNETGNADNTSN